MIARGKRSALDLVDDELQGLGRGRDAGEQQELSVDGARPRDENAGRDEDL